MTNNERVYRTKGGRTLTQADIDRMADEVAQPDYEIGVLVRRPGRPSIGASAAELVPVRLEPELAASLDKRVAEENTNRSEIIRRALREYLAN